MLAPQIFTRPTSPINCISSQDLGRKAASSWPLPHISSWILWQLIPGWPTSTRAAFHGPTHGSAIGASQPLDHGSGTVCQPGFASPTTTSENFVGSWSSFCLIDTAAHSDYTALKRLLNTFTHSLTAGHPSAHRCFSASAETCGSALVSPNIIIQWRVRWPLILADESGAVGNDPVLYHAVCAGAPSCWKMKPAGRRVLQSATKFGSNVSTYSLAFTLSFSAMKLNRPLPLKQTPAETMTRGANLAIWTRRRFLSTKRLFPTAQTWLSWLFAEINVFLMWEKHLCSCLWQTSKKCSVALKVCCLIVSKMTWTEEKMFSSVASAAIFRVLLLVTGWPSCDKSVHWPF